MKRIKWKSLFIAQAIVLIVSLPLMIKCYKHELSTLEWFSFNTLILMSLYPLIHKINDYFSDDK